MSKAYFSKEAKCACQNFAPCDKDKEQLLVGLQENWHEAYKMLIS